MGKENTHHLLSEQILLKTEQKEINLASICYDKICVILCRPTHLVELASIHWDCTRWRWGGQRRTPPGGTLDEGGQRSTTYSQERQAAVVYVHVCGDDSEIERKHSSVNKKKKKKGYYNIIIECVQNYCVCVCWCW